MQRFLFAFIVILLCVLGGRHFWQVKNIERELAECRLRLHREIQKDPTYDGESVLLCMRAKGYVFAHTIPDDSRFCYEYAPGIGPEYRDEKCYHPDSL